MVWSETYQTLLVGHWVSHSQPSQQAVIHQTERKGLITERSCSSHACSYQTCQQGAHYIKDRHTGTGARQTEGKVVWPRPKKAVIHISIHLQALGINDKTEGTDHEREDWGHFIHWWNNYNPSIQPWTVVNALITLNGSKTDGIDYGGLQFCDPLEK